MLSINPTGWYVCYPLGTLVTVARLGGSPWKLCEPHGIGSNRSDPDGRDGPETEGSVLQSLCWSRWSDPVVRVLAWAGLWKQATLQHGPGEVLLTVHFGAVPSQWNLNLDKPRSCSSGMDVVTWLVCMSAIMKIEADKATYYDSMDIVETREFSVRSGMDDK